MLNQVCSILLLICRILNFKEHIHGFFRNSLTGTSKLRRLAMRLIEVRDIPLFVNLRASSFY